jgi:hypothetical protein
MLSSAYSCNPLKIDPEFSSRYVEHIFYSSQHAKPLLQLWIQTLIKSTVCFLLISCLCESVVASLKYEPDTRYPFCATGMDKQLLEIQWESSLYQFLGKCATVKITSLCHICLSTCNNSPPNGCIFVKFYI